MKKYLSIFLVLSLFFIFFPKNVLAGCEDLGKYKGRVTSLEEVSCEGVDDGNCIAYSVEMLEGDLKGEKIDIQPMSTAFGYSKYSIGDKVYISGICGLNDEIIWGIENYSRESSIICLLLVFVLIVFLVSGVKGLGSVLGLVMSFFVIYFVMIPLSIKTGNVILCGILSAFLVLVISIYLSHGFNRKSTIALFCTFIGLLVISILSIIFISSTKLTGFGNEEVYMLLSQIGGKISVKGILFISILVSGIGILDDVTVSQVSTVIELSKANPNMKIYELYKSSMNIGRDHISSMVNTLFIAYAGSSLSMIMLMNANGATWYEIINGDFFAEEIVRAVVSSMGLVLIVPITAYIASIFVPKLIEMKKI